MAILLLLLPAVTLTVTPIASAIALPIAIAVYVIISGALLLMSPTISLSDGVLSAGSAQVPVAALGEVTVLGESALRRTIGADADARAFLLVRGNLHRGVRVEISDQNDPTPYWVLTSRRPQSLAAAINAARAAVS